MITAIAHIIFGLLFVYLFINTLYISVMAVAGRFYKSVAQAPATDKKRIAVLITSFMEDDVIVQSVKAACAHNYPADRFQVHIAGDRLQPATIDALRATGATVYQLAFDKGSKARSLNHVLNAIDERRFDITLVLDGDNVMVAGVLEKINDAFASGFEAVQVHRTAKNRDTSIATLDAVSEEINNHLFRKAQHVLGLSSALSGSGMAFPFGVLKRIYNKPGILDNPACDREVDFEIMKAGLTVEYLDEALVLDEKVARRQVFQNQRRRWLESQIVHLRLFARESGSIRHKDRNYWNKLFINLIPPRILLLGTFLIVAVALALEQVFDISITGISIWYWSALFLAYVFSLLLAIPSSLLTWRSLRALLSLPLLALSYLWALFSMRASRTDFVHTPKSFTGKSADK